MSVTHTLNEKASSSAGNSLGASWTELGNSEINLDIQLAASSTNVLATVAFTAANVQSCVLIADHNMTIKTNSSGSPADTINLVAGIPWVYSKSAGYSASPFGTNVTAFYLTCTPATRFQMKALLS